MSYSILVNTTDSFEDCWLPFFKLFDIYWPDYKGTIYLNTEKKDFKYKDLDIVCVKNCTHGQDFTTWSEALIIALDTVKTDIVLYMQEDYFLKADAQNATVEHFVKLMQDNDIDGIQLTDQSSKGPFNTTTPYKDLWELKWNAGYRISCQGALWKKEVLKQYVRKHENPWQFEWFGTMRAKLLKHKFFVVSRNIYKQNVNDIIPYVSTGVIQGRWYVKVVDLFKKHSIDIDYAKRGFIDDKQKRAYGPRIYKKIKNVDVKSLVELFTLRHPVK
jgi:hypothetical protein